MPRVKKNSRAKLLKASPYFRDWPEGNLDKLAPFLKMVNYARGEELLQENKRARFLYILLKGKVALSIRRGTGDLIIEVIKKKGALLGWSAIVPPRKYTASAKALEDVKVLKIRGKDLEDYLQFHPPLAWQFWQKLASLIAFRLLHARQALAETLV
ncbi:MAG: cyclic nucleotide-binding domain-containing protein [Thermodesulfobacteriota bacterium]